MVGVSSWEALSNTKNSEIPYYLVRYRSAEVFIFSSHIIFVVNVIQGVYTLI